MGNKVNNTPVETEEEINIEEYTPITVTGRVVGCKLLNVRENPSLDAVVVGLLSEGDTIEIEAGANESFYQTLIGYVKKEFIEIL